MIGESDRRRLKQQAFNAEHNITPESIQKSITNVLASLYEADYYTVPIAAEEQAPYMPGGTIEDRIKGLEKAMRDAAKKLEFERAAELRDKIMELKAQLK
jgi:excinuclease ABC subunit B